MPPRLLAALLAGPPLLLLILALAIGLSVSVNSTITSFNCHDDHHYDQHQSSQD